MSRVRLLDLVRPFQPILPVVPSPNRKVRFDQKVSWTAVTLLIYLIFSQVPLYGILSSDAADPFYRTRAILASHRGTLMELGITPTLFTKLIIDVFAYWKLIDVDFSSKEDVTSYVAAKKLTALVFSVGQGMIYILMGLYGLPQELGVGICLLLVVQLVLATLILILLDEIFLEGYALGGGTGNTSSASLFVGSNICGSIFWKALSPTTVNTVRGQQFEGALISLFHLLFTWNDKGRALNEACWREGLPTVTNLIATTAVFMMLMYLSDFRIDIPVKSCRNHGQRGVYVIWLFDTQPVHVFEGVFTSNVLIISQLLADRIPHNFLVRFLGISYYMSPPLTLQAALLNPAHTIIHVVFRVIACATFWMAWIYVSGRAPRAIAEQLKDQNITMVKDDHSEGSMYKELERVVPTAAALGGAILSFICVVADLTGAIGGGNGILMAMFVTYSFVEITKNEFVGDSGLCWPRDSPAGNLDTHLLDSLEYVSGCRDGSKVGEAMFFPSLSSVDTK